MSQFSVMPMPGDSDYKAPAPMTRDQIRAQMPGIAEPTDAQVDQWINRRQTPAVPSAPGSGWNDMINTYQKQAGDILAKYSDLAANAVAPLYGSNKTEHADIQQQYAHGLGKLHSFLTSAGLSNSTVRSSSDTGLLGQKMRADTASDEALAKNISGISSQYGLAALGAAGQFLGQQGQLQFNYDQLNQQWQKYLMDQEQQRQNALAQLQADRLRSGTQTTVAQTYHPPAKDPWNSLIGL